MLRYYPNTLGYVNKTLLLGILGGVGGATAMAPVQASISAHALGDV